MPPTRRSSRIPKSYRTYSDHELEALRVQLEGATHVAKANALREFFARIGGLWGQNALTAFNHIFHPLQDHNWGFHRHAIRTAIGLYEVHYYGTDVSGPRNRLGTKGKDYTHREVFQDARLVRITWDVTGHPKDRSKQIRPSLKDFHRPFRPDEYRYYDNDVADLLRRFLLIEHLTLDVYQLEQFRHGLPGPAWFPDLDVMIPVILEAAVGLRRDGTVQHFKQNRLLKLSVILPSWVISIPMSNNPVQPRLGFYGAEGPELNKLANVEEWLRMPQLPQVFNGNTPITMTPSAMRTEMNPALGVTVAQVRERQPVATARMPGGAPLPPAPAGATEVILPGWIEIWTANLR